MHAYIIIVYTLHVHNKNAYVIIMYTHVHKYTTKKLIIGNYCIHSASIHS